MIKRAVKFNWVLEPSKFLSREEAKKLLETARDRAEVAYAKRQKTPVRDYFIVDLALSTGLWLMEIAQLNCCDVFIRDGISSLLFRNGKCGKRRLVRFGESLKEHLTNIYCGNKKFASLQSQVILCFCPAILVAT